MTILMRPSLRDTTHHCNNAHAGLLLTRGLTEWQTGEKTLKAALIDKVASVQSNTLYKKAFERGVKIIGATAHFVNEALDEGPIIAKNITPTTFIQKVIIIKLIWKTLKLKKIF
mgnify:CR=1 FL=1